MQNKFPKIPLFLSAMFFLFSFFTLFYFFQEINNNNEESQLKEIEWQTEMLRRDEIKMLDRSIKIIEIERKELETHFAKSSDVVPFLDTIERLAPQVGAKAEVVSVDIGEDKVSLIVGMKASGTFEGIYKFLTLLENSPYELEFVSIDIQKRDVLNTSDQNQIGSRWNATFKIRLLSFIP